MLLYGLAGSWNARLSSWTDSVGEAVRTDSVGEAVEEADARA